VPTPAGWGVGALRPPAVGPVVTIAAVVKERAPLVVVVVKVVMGKAPLDSRPARIRSPTLRRAAPVAQDSNGREPHHKDSRSLVGSLAGGSCTGVGRFAMMVATSYGILAVISIQAGVSSILS
jgi:hypothetical protein